MSAPMMASDAANPQFIGASNPDAAIVVKFYSRAVHQPFESIKQNRPIYLDVDFVMIHTPGNQLNIVDTPVTWEHKQRFAQQWAQYQAGKGSGMEMGTPVTAWPLLSSAQAEEFRGLKFYTVEQLANASDGQLQNIGMVGGMNPIALRERAKAFLGQAQAGVPAAAQAQENADLRAQLAAQQKQIDAMLQAGIAPPEKPKRHRRTKEEMAAAQAAQAEPLQTVAPQQEAGQP